MNVVAEIKPYLFLGSAAAGTIEFFKKKNITLVINAASPAYNPKLCDNEKIRLITLDAKDDINYSIQNHFEEVTNQIYSEKKNGGKVYIHCIAGISRSSTFVIAFLMRFKELSLLRAYKYVHKKRLFIRPNTGFWKALVEYEKKLYGSNTVEMIQHGDDYIPSVYMNEYKAMV